MLTVLLVLLIMSTIGSAVLAQAITGLPQVRHEQDFSAALAAAEAGVDDFTDRLDQNYNYATSASDGNLALTSYVAVGPGSTSSYTYRVVANTLCSGTPNVCVTVTGSVGKVKRSITVGFQPHGFLDALDMSDYNLVDPTLVQANGWSVAQTTSECVYHAYDHNTTTGGTGPASGCGSLLNYWVTGNTFNGPLESNDDFYICGSPVFNSTVTSGDAGTAHPNYWLDPAGCGGDNPHFNGGTPVGNQRITLPPSISTIQQYAATGTSTGCLYTGPTSITLSGTTMTVVSPDTTGANAANSGCLGTGVALPADGTIYVQDIPGTGTCSVTVSWSGDACNLGDAFVQGTTTGKLTIAASNNIIITAEQCPVLEQHLQHPRHRHVLREHQLHGSGSQSDGQCSNPRVEPLLRRDELQSGFDRRAGQHPPRWIADRQVHGHRGRIRRRWPGKWLRRQLHL
jgi:hypothetical protein